LADGLIHRATVQTVRLGFPVEGAANGLGHELALGGLAGWHGRRPVACAFFPASSVDFGCQGSA